MELPNEMMEIVDAASKGGAAAKLLDYNNRVLWANDSLRKIYAFTDFTKPQTYESCYWDCIKHKVIDDPSVYENPHDWLAKAKAFRRSTPLAQYMVRHKSGQLYLARHQMVPGFGYLFIRLDVTNCMKVNLGRQLAKFLGGSLFNFSKPGGRGIGTATVSKSGRLLDANEEFFDYLGEDDTFYLGQGRFSVWSDYEDNKILKVINKHASSIGKEDVSIMRVERKSGAGFYIISVSAPEANSWSSVFEISGVAVISIYDPSSSVKIRPESLRQLFGLTHSEASVAIEVASGKDVAEVAAVHGVAVGTVRNQLKGVFSKTGVNRQAELVRVVSQISYFSESISHSG